MKVGYIRSSFNPGGTESLLLNLYNFNQKQFVFDYFILKGGNLIKELKSKENNYHLIYRKSYVDFKALYKIHKVLSKKEIGILHSHQLIELIYALILKLLNPRLKIYHTIHGFSSSKYYAWLEKRLVVLTNKYFTVSSSSREYLIQMGYPSKRFHILYNFVKQPLIADTNDINWFNSIIDRKDSDIVIGMIGNFVWQKDQITLLKAIHVLQSKNPNYKLVFIGNTQTNEGTVCKDYVKTHNINNVFFLGSIVNASKFISLFDLFVFATIRDTFGIALIEAMMSGVPILASNVGVCKELRYSENYYSLYNLDDHIDLGTKIEKILSSNLTDEIISAKNYALKRFSESNYISKLMQN